MSQAGAIYPIKITADDKTAKGAASAEKRVGGVAKRAGILNTRAASDSERAWRRSGSGLIRTFGAVEKASARAFGTGSLTSGITGRLGAVKEAAAAAGSGLGEASTAGGVLSSTLGTLGVVAGATVGVLAAAAYGAFKLADGWAKGARNLANLSDTIGVATRDLQAFTAAGERAGVDKGASAGALGGLGQTLNDARYGRNNEAVAVLGRLGLKLKMNSDGSVDTIGMIPAIANAIAGQRNAQTRRLIAGKLGIGDAALPMFLQGGGALSADMADATKHAAVLSADEIAKGRRVARKGAIAGQLLERGEMVAGSAAASVAEGGYDAAISGGRGIADGATSFGSVVRGSFAPAATKLDRAADKLLAVSGVSGLSRYLGAVSRVESGGNRFAHAGSSSAVGLYQFTEGTWLEMMRRHGASHGLGWAASAITQGRHGPTIADASLRARVLGLRSDARVSSLLAADMTNDGTPALAAALGRNPNAGDLYMSHFLGVGGASRFFRLERRNRNAGAADLFPKEAGANHNIFYDRTGRERSLGEVHDLMSRKIEIALKIEGLPAGTRATARSGQAVAISHAKVGH